MCPWYAPSPQGDSSNTGSNQEESGENDVEQQQDDISLNLPPLSADNGQEDHVVPENFGENELAPPSPKRQRSSVEAPTTMVENRSRSSATLSLMPVATMSPQPVEALLEDLEDDEEQFGTRLSPPLQEAIQWANPEEEADYYNRLLHFVSYRTGSSADRQLAEGDSGIETDISIDLSM